MKKILSIYFLILSLYGCTAQTETAEVVPHLGENFDSIITDVKSRYQIPGISVAVVKGVTLQFIKYVGETDNNSNQEISETSLFSAQSLSKTFTSLACLSAVRDGMLNLDTPITNYLPEFHVNSIHEKDAWKKICLRHLLSHTSGLAADAPVGNNFTANYKAEVYAELDDRIESLNETWLRSKVGSRYSYSNVGFDLVAKIIEVVSGKSFDDYVQQKLFVPLQMEYSTFNLSKIETLDNKALGHCNNYEGVVPVKFAAIGAGGLYTCSMDMMHFLESAIHGFPQILDSTLFKEFTQIPYSEESSGYALGLTVNDFQLCTPVYGHTGNGYGFSALMSWIPAHKMGIVILSNRESSYQGLQEIQQLITDDLLSSEIQDLDCHDIGKYPNTFEQADREYYQRISGAYSNGNITLNFLVRNNSFGVLAPDDGSFQKLHFTSKNRWFIEDEGFIRFSYNNKIISNLNNGMTFAKVEIDASQKTNVNPKWESYTGRYRSYAYGILASTEIIDIGDGHLRLNGNYLSERLPGLFFDQFGQVVDFRNGKVRIEYGEYLKIE